MESDSGIRLIAFHASEGLALQILERQPEANRLFNSPSSPITKEVERVCDNWNRWYEDCNDWWSGCDGSHVFQVSSCIGEVERLYLLHHHLFACARAVLWLIFHTGRFGHLVCEEVKYGSFKYVTSYWRPDENGTVFSPRRSTIYSSSNIDLGVYC